MVESFFNGYEWWALGYEGNVSDQSKVFMCAKREILRIHSG